jgi:hypothetical protein
MDNLLKAHSYVSGAIRPVEQGGRQGTRAVARAVIDQI